MSGPTPPGQGPTGAQPIPLRQSPQQTTRLPAWARFAQFLLGIGLGSLPLAMLFLGINPTLALALYVTLMLLSIVLIAREPYRFVGFGMLAMILAAPVIAVQACFVSLGGPQGYLPPAPPLSAHSARIIPPSFRPR